MQKHDFTRRSVLAVSLAATAQVRSHEQLDLFLLAGQSNMAGRGDIEPKDRQPVDGLFSLSAADKWVPAVDPVHFDKPKIAGVGLARSFGRTLIAARPGAQIGLIPAAFGGSLLDEWAPGGKHYVEALRRVALARASGRLRGLLWHQGESEGNDETRARTYLDRFAGVVEAFRRDLESPGMPVVVGQLGGFLRTTGVDFPTPFADVVNRQLAQVPVVIPNSAFVPSGGLVHRGDELHFNAPSLRELGRRYAHSYLMLDPAWT
jgi:hypothetical protein